MELLRQPTPLADAVAKLDAREPVTSVLNSAEWAQMPVALRERALFSAGVDWADFLTAQKAKLLDALSLRKEQVARGEAYVDRSSFIGDLRKLVIAVGKSDGSGGLKDLASRARLGLIYDIQTQSAIGHTRWKFEQRPAVLAAFPAQELLRSTARAPRGDWESRWTDLGGQIFNGRMIALKTDPLWASLSRFGVPWPPFDFGSRRQLRDVDRAEAEQLGLIGPDDDLAPIEMDFNAGLASSAEIADPDVRAGLTDLFGAQIAFDGAKARWTGRAA